MKPKGTFGITLDRKELWRLVLEQDEPIYKVSKASGLDKSTLYRILKRGRAYPSTVSKLAKFFNVATSPRKKILLRKG